MKTHFKLLAILLVLPVTLQAQDDEAESYGVIGYQQGILPGTMFQYQNQLADSVLRPVLDGMVGEGMVQNWGIAIHAWGDEWNWNWWMTTDDHHGLVTAWDSVVARVELRTPGGIDAMYSSFESHKDNIYDISYQYARELAEGEDPPGFLMINQHQISDFSGMDSINVVMRPILNTLVDEGLLNNWGVANHLWADEWNYNFWMTTKDHAAFLTAWGEYVSRLQEAAPNAFNDFSKMSKRHRDNLYVIR